MKITIKNLQKKIPVHPKRIKRAILNVLSHEGINPVRNTKHSRRKNKISNGVKKAGEITVCFVSDKKIRELNRKYLGKDRPTDVLAFDSGDIAVSVDTAMRNARLFRTTLQGELSLYAVHGVLHLLGYDDKTARQRQIIQNKAEKVLNADFRKSNADFRR